MELTHDFTVPADVETTWATFMDLEAVGGCFPGLGEATQRDLADATGLSQSRISQLLSRWPSGWGVFNAGGRPSRWIVTDPDGLLTAWLDLYLPEERVISFWYGLEEPWEQAKRAMDALAGRGRLSGDLAADALAPWALPRKALIYTDEACDLSVVGLVPSEAAAATLGLVATRDPAAFPSPRAEALLAPALPSPSLPLADPLVVLADMARSDELDADQAFRRLRARLVELWQERLPHD